LLERSAVHGCGGIGDSIDKPKGMRWATFDPTIEQLEAAEVVVNAPLLRFVQKPS